MKKLVVYSRRLATAIAAIVLSGTVGARTFQTVAATPGRIDTAGRAISIVDAAAPSGERREVGDPA